MNEGLRSTGEADSASMSRAEPPAERRLLTIPNLLCAIRLIGSPFLLALGIMEQATAFTCLFFLLALTDWVDGKLAIALKQRTVFGARLDSWADATFFSALLLGGLFMLWELLLGELWWILAAVGSYALTTAAGFWKFGRWPSYHTRAAKASWLFIIVATICLLGNWAVWPFRLAMAIVTLTNLEATLITLVLPGWRADVPSLYHAWKIAETR
jgi:CDP-diacylglycerol--glycerol-3-phosphate 3-phosphatidyltransferase